MAFCCCQWWVADLIILSFFVSSFCYGSIVLVASLTIRKLSCPLSLSLSLSGMKKFHKQISSAMTISGHPFCSILGGNLIGRIWMEWRYLFKQRKRMDGRRVSKAQLTWVRARPADLFLIGSSFLFLRSQNLVWVLLHKARKTHEKSGMRWIDRTRSPKKPRKPSSIDTHTHAHTQDNQKQSNHYQKPTTHKTIDKRQLEYLKPETNAAQPKKTKNFNRWTMVHPKS